MSADALEVALYRIRSNFDARFSIAIVYGPPQSQEGGGGGFRPGELPPTLPIDCTRYIYAEIHFYPISNRLIFGAVPIALIVVLPAIQILESLFFIENLLNRFFPRGSTELSRLCIDLTRNSNPT